MERSWVYMLTNKDNNVLYTGVTSNLLQRINQHRDKSFGGFSARYNLSKVVYVEELPNIREAIAREKAIKRLSRHRKELLIDSINPYWQELIEG
ncbi:MAG: GIY-YIG nuclease family protein [Alistipes sp.]|nr:GIY-YIG nuclease family protein [Alistipes sp.]